LSLSIQLEYHIDKIPARETSSLQEFREVAAIAYIVPASRWPCDFSFVRQAEQQLNKTGWKP
jgi:hypothetical protein